MGGVILSAAVLLAALSVSAPAAAPLTRLEYRVAGVQLQVAPTELSVPKGLAGSVAVDLVAGTNGALADVSALVGGTRVEAILRGPSFPARKLLGLPNQALMLPPLNLVGDYRIDGIQLVDSATGEVRFEGQPSSVPVRVFDEVMISRVTSRPLTLQEIQDKGISIDEANFQAVEFEVAFVIDGQTIPVKFPVVAPTFAQQTETIPRAEREAQLAQAELINQELTRNVDLPADLKAAGLNFDLRVINFQRVEGPSDDGLKLEIPPIPALMVIPGNIGFLNQFFSVMIYTANGSPLGSGLSIRDIQAHLKLPAGQDQMTGTYVAPGDDPLRFARLGTNAVIVDILPVMNPGVDGQTGTQDDVARLQPGDTGQAEFFVEGLREGLHIMDLDLTATLDGFAAGAVQITGRASGSVLVRNPNFSMAFSHPRTVRAGEPYTASVTLLNTSLVDANEVSVTLAGASVSGAVLESAETVQLGTVKSGETKTAKYQLRAQRTGSISFSNISGDDDLVGRFRLTTGIDERGVELSPAAIGYPEYVDDLPPTLLAAADRVLGQALSVATAGRLPAGVIALSRATVERRAVELAEAGQRLRYGDAAARVAVDLLLDWQGGRWFDAGFDQIVTGTAAGREFREALQAELTGADGLSPAARLAARAADIAGRSELWWIAAADDRALEPGLLADAGPTDLDRGVIARAAGYRGTNGHWLVAGPQTNDVVFQWTATNALADPRLWLLRTDINGTGLLLEWRPGALPSGACCTYRSVDTNGVLSVDMNADGTAEATVIAVATVIRELPPHLIGVVQDLSVTAGRPDRKYRACLVPEPGNYGSVVAVLFSKPMRQEDVNRPAAYELDDGVGAQSVQIQPGGRVALVNLLSSVGTIRARVMTVRDIADRRGNVLAGDSVPVQATAFAGMALAGRVVRANGAPAANVPVTLTMYDGVANLDGECKPFVVRAFQRRTDPAGRFAFDYVMAGIPYSISATDTTGLSDETVAALLEATRADRLQRDKLEQLANSPSVRDTLLGQFAVASLPEAIALAEGVDRALLRDFIPVGSPRLGSEGIVALRFRGRGVVTGTVVGQDGTTPVGNTAVNLFPDPDSRELGRGIFSDASGRFQFYGVPLGVFTVEATHGSGLRRSVSGLLQRAGETNEVTIVLTRPADPARSTVGGRVLEADGLTPHVGARVFVGHYGENQRLLGVVAAVTTDDAGAWIAADIPVGSWDLLAVACDGQRRAERYGVAVVAGVVAQANLNLQARATVRGRVQFANGRPATNALVAGGEALVRTDTNGLFTLTGVPTGRRSIAAGLERNPAAGIPFSRIGNADVDVLDGADNFVAITFEARGMITGRVFDSQGLPVPGVRVALPWGDGFFWADADGAGRYVFENQPLAEFTVSAPSGPAVNTDVSGILETLRTSGSEEEIMAAINEAFAIFTGAGDPYLRGETASYNPAQWGYAMTRLTVDGQTAVADIRYLPQGTISGVVKNGQGVPIGARVRLTGIGPTPSGAVSFILRGERDSDPALGTFEFPDQALVGPWGLQAASPFFPVVISASGQTEPELPNATNVVLQFPSEKLINGRLTGRVLGLDGLPTGANVEVRISFGDLAIRTDSNGLFDTHLDLPAIDEGGRGLSYSLEATDPATGLRGIAYAALTAGTSTFATVHLLGKGALTVTIRQADGVPAVGAQVTVRGGAYPSEEFHGTSDTNGQLALLNVFEGPYAVGARWVSGLTTIEGRCGAVVARGSTATATVVLTPTATVRGVCVGRDLVTPIPFAHITLGDLGFTSTDAAGRFEVKGVPLGTYRLTGRDPLNGRGGVLSVTLGTQGEIREVMLLEQFLGTVSGGVLASQRNGLVAGASVTLNPRDGVTASRTVTSGPDGRFSFPGTPAGSFTLQALDPGGHFSGNAEGTLPENVDLVTVDVPLEGLAAVRIFVLRPDGVTPATNATVTLGDWSVDTDASGRVTFADLALGQYGVRVRSRIPGETHSALATRLTLGEPGQAPDVFLVLPGVGAVVGRVLAGDGLAAIADAQVTLMEQGPLEVEASRSMLTDMNGDYHFDNVAVGAFRLTARQGLLGCGQDGRVSTNDEVVAVDLTLAESGSVIGRLVRSDGTTPVSGAEIFLSFTPSLGLPGAAIGYSDTNGAFAFSEIPKGAVQLEADVLAFNGIARLSGTIATNNQILDLGDVRLDEEDPFVRTVVPATATSGVPINVRVELTFNEALDPATVHAEGIYIRSGTSAVPATVELLADPGDGVLRLVRVAPNSPLVSETTYEVVVINGDRVSATGQTTARGPRDRLGRPLWRAFISSFTTRDDDPPRLLSFTPTNGAVQIDPRSVIRMSFNEPIQATGAVIRVNGPGGEVGGTVDVGVNQQVLVFTPSNQLAVNAVYTGSVSNVRDLAGNLATNQPLTTTFWTLDTLGPVIAQLRVRGAPRLSAGSTVTLDAVLAVPEADARVKMSADLVPFGETAAGDLDLPFRLPAPGSVTIRGIALDRYGNEGPFAELALQVVSNLPPAAALRRVAPAAGALASGQSFTLEVSATDDVAVTSLFLTATGALTLSTNWSDGSVRTVAYVVPTNTPPGTPLQFTAEAADEPGARSSSAVLDLGSTIDGTAPTLAIISPAADTLLDPTNLLHVTVRATDNSARLTLQATLSGALVATQSVVLAVTPNVPGTNVFEFSIAAALRTGTPLNVQVTATDDAGQTSAVTRTFRMPDQYAPRFAASAPADGATNSSLWLTEVMLRFGEAIAPGTVTTNNLAMLDAAGRVPCTMQQDPGDGAIIRLRPTALPLRPGVTYTSWVSTALADAASNRWVDAAGSAPPTGGAFFRFTTAAIRSVTPTQGAPVISGYSLSPAVTFDSGLGAQFFHFVLNGRTTNTVAVADGATNVVGALAVPLDASNAVVTIAAGRPGQPLYPVGSITMNLQAARPPTLAVTNRIEVTNGVAAGISVGVHDANGDARVLCVRQVGGAPGDWAQLGWNGGATELYAQAVGGFDAVRGGAVSLSDGSLTVATRAAITNAFPLAVITGTNALSAEYLATVQMLVIAGPTNYSGAIQPLSATEQQALRRYVEQGGAAVVLADCDSYAGTNSAPANASLLNPFGLSATGTVNSATTKIVVGSPAASPWTDGPFGLITNFAAPYPGWFSVTGTATVVGNLEANNQPALALIPAGRLAAGSGPVFLASDAAMPPNVVLNALAVSGFDREVFDFVGTLTLQSTQVGTNMLEIVATDGLGLAVTQNVQVVVVPGPRTRVTWSGPTHLDVTEMAFTTVTFQAECSAGPIIWAGLDPSNPSPAFVSFGGLNFTESGSTGMVTGALCVGPLPDAAGDYTVQLVARGRSSTSAVHTVSIHVADAPGFQMTHWNWPSIGSYEMEFNWSAGAPNATNLPVIDARGGFYSVMVSQHARGAPVVVDEAEAEFAIQPPGSQILVAVADVRRGEVTLGSPGALYAGFSALPGRPLVNRGTITLIDECYLRAQGSAPWIENSGLLRTESQTAQKNQAFCELPLIVAASGRLLLDTNTMLSATSLTVAGLVEVAAEAQLAAARMVLLDGAAFAGSGQVQVSTALRVQGDARLAGEFVLGTAAGAVQGSGGLEVGAGGLFRSIGALSMTGSLDVAGALDLSAAGETNRILGALVLEPGSVLTNAGTLLVGAFTNHGGTVVGAAPVVQGLSGASIRAQSIAGFRPDPSLRIAALAVSGTSPRILWTFEPGRQFAVDVSDDLRLWRTCAVDVVELAPGCYEGTVSATPQGPRFYRVRPK